MRKIKVEKMQNLQMTDPKRELAPQLRELVGKSRLK